ncbi:major histocompatibility complex class I-related gene protein-like isoform 7-T7 [Pholidichthys leucotaenia]
MKTSLFVLFLCFQGISAVTHSLQYFYTASSGVPGFPEFVVVGMVDGQQTEYYDSEIKKMIPKQDWMEKNEGPEYWEEETWVAVDAQQIFKGNIDVAKQRFNQTGGIHLAQRMFGCEWDDETDVKNGYDQYGYDEEDFIALDLKTESWIAPIPQAVITRMKWDKNKAYMSFQKNYYNQECVDWLKKYVNYGRDSLMRKVLPSVSLLQKSSSSPVTCHATGFYPDKAELMWRKDGVELHEEVDKGEILPNHDGSFQMSVDLKLSSVSVEDWDKYDCVFQLSGVEDDRITKLDKKVIRTNERNDLTTTTTIIAVAVVVLAVIAVVGFIFYKKKAEKRPPSPVVNPEIQEEMPPKSERNNEAHSLWINSFKEQISIREQSHHDFLHKL